MTATFDCDHRPQGSQPETPPATEPPADTTTIEEAINDLFMDAIDVHDTIWYDGTETLLEAILRTIDEKWEAIRQEKLEAIKAIWLKWEVDNTTTWQAMGEIGALMEED